MLEALRQDLALAAQDWRRPAAERWLLVVMGLALALGAGLLLTGGYHAGFHAVNGLARQLPGWVWESLTFMGDTLFALVLFLISARRWPRLLWAAVVAALIGTVFAQVLKDLLSMDRPPGVLLSGTFELIGPDHRHSSFPSGHTLTAFTLAGLWLFELRNRYARLGLLILAAVVGMSRVVVGVHWPVDVVFGAFGGCLSAWLGWRLAARWRWGMGCMAHLAAVLVFSAAAVLLLAHDGGYPQARWLAQGLAVLGLAVTVWNYALAPLRQPATSVGPR